MKNKGKVVILSYYPFPCTEPVLENVFAKELGKKLDIIWLFQGNTSGGRQQIWHNSQVLLSKVVKGNDWKAKLINKFLACYKLIQLLKLLRFAHVKIVLIRDLPLATLLIIPLRSFFKFKIYYQYSAPLAKMNLAIFKFNKTPKRFYYLVLGLAQRFLVRQIIEKVDIIFPITEFHKKELLAYVPADRLVPLTMGVDEEWLQRNKKKIDHLEKLKKNNFLITYFGTLNFLRKPQFILEVFNEVKKNCPNCKMLLMLKTSSRWEYEKLRSFCRNLQIEKDVIFTEQLDQNSLQDHLQYCDLSISAIPPEDYFKISSPTKLYESLGNGVPVVANKGIFEQEKVILESGGGVLVDYEVTPFSSAIVNLLNNRVLREKKARDGKNYVIRNYSYQMIAKKIAPYFE